MSNNKADTILLAILACLLWSSAFAGIKLGLPYTTPLQFAGIRFFISGLLVLPIAYRRNPKLISIAIKNWKTILLLGFLQIVVQYALFYTGISMVPGAVGAIVIGSSPLFIALIAHRFMPDDKMTFGKLFCILFGILGVVLVSIGKDRFGVAGDLALLGILILVGNNILSGFTNILIAKEKGMIPPFVLSSFSMILGGLALFLISIPIEGLSWPPKPPIYYISLAWLSILSAVAISIWTLLLKRPGIKISNLNLWKFLIPVAGATLSWLILPQESPDLLSVSGMIVIAASLIILNIFNRKDQKNALLKG